MDCASPAAPPIPGQALEFLNGAVNGATNIDVLFLDIQMPGMNGFELLSRLAIQPFVIFTTAYDQYALRAFEVNSIDYLLKPIETEQLERALGNSGDSGRSSSLTGSGTPISRPC